MFARCHGTRDIAEVYRRLGFLTVSCALDRVSLVASPKLGAVVIPPESGPGIRDRLLADSRCRSAPILSYARPGREWVFVVGPSWGRGFAEPTLSALEAHGVRVLVAGQRIWLPMSDNRVGWYWITPPVDAESLPYRTTVIATVRDHLEDLRTQTAGA